MAVGTYITVGVYLKCTPRAYEYTGRSVPECPRGHVGQHDSFCSVCGATTEAQEEILKETYTWWDLVDNDIEDADVSEEERDLLKRRLTRLEYEGGPSDVEYLSPKDTLFLDAEDADGEYEIVPADQLTLSPNELVDRLMDAMHHDGIIELLEIIYEKIEFKYGALATWS